MQKLFWIGIAGSLGAMTRFSLGNLISSRTISAFPYGTFIINVSGSLLLGFLATIGAQSALISSTLRAALTVGFLGAYTTFSTWSLETVRLIEAGSYALAMINIGGSIAAGLGGAWIGMIIARMISQ